MIMARLVPVLVVMALAACATPEVHLRHPDTGQIATCGGSVSGSLIGGMAGHAIQKTSERGCIEQYLAQGYAVLAVR